MPANRRRTPPAQEPPSQPRLMVSAKHLESQIDDRLRRGQEFLDLPVDDLESLEARQRDYYTWNEYNETLLKSSFDSPQPANAYRNMSGAWPSDRPLPQRLEWLRRDFSGQMRRLGSIKEQLGLYQLHSSVTALGGEQTPDSPEVGTEIFIVHGHDGEAKSVVARFLSKLLGQEPVILHEQSNRGLTIIEKFEYHAAQAACAVVLLTADDMGGPKSGEQQSRARQNVVLELGFFIGKLGRDRVVILYEPGVESPSDLQGVLYTPLDSLGAWRMAVASELQAMGLNVDSKALLS